MDENTLYTTLQDLLGASIEQRAHIQQTILVEQEEVIAPLTNIFFAGVNDALGTLILEIMADIGGFEAVANLMNVFVFETQRPALQRVAATGLWHNRDNLSAQERADVEAFLGEVL